MKKFTIILLALLMTALLMSGCAKPTASNKESELTAGTLTGSWELFEPVGSWASKMNLQKGGKLSLDGASGKWSVTDDVLELKLDDGELIRFEVTLEGGYYMVLDNRLMGFSLWYINPMLFAQGELDSSFLGTWLNSDGSDSITLTEDGKYIQTILAENTTKTSNFFARDGIVRVYDEETGAIYYSYQISEESKTLMLSHYDTSGSTDSFYYPPADRSQFIGEWKKITGSGEGTSIPDVILLKSDGTGKITGSQYEGKMTWEVFADNLLVMHDKQGKLIDLYVDVVVGSMYVSDEMGSEAMLVCDKQLKDVYDSITLLEGEWTNYAGVTVKVDADGSMCLTIEEDNKKTVYEGQTLIGSDMIKLTTPDTELYLIYQLDSYGETLILGPAESFVNPDQPYWTMKRVLN